MKRRFKMNRIASSEDYKVVNNHCVKCTKETSKSNTEESLKASQLMETIFPRLQGALNLSQFVFTEEEKKELK